MDHGHKGVSGLKAFVRIVCYSFHALIAFLKCDATTLNGNSILSHIISHHTTVSFSDEDTSGVSKETESAFVSRVTAFHRQKQTKLKAVQYETELHFGLLRAFFPHA